MNTFGPTALAIKHHNEVFRPGNRIQPYPAEILKDYEYIDYKVVAQSTWEKNFPRNKLIYNRYGMFNKEAIRGLKKFFPMDHKITAKDALFLPMRVGLDSNDRFGLAITEEQWHDFMCQSVHYLIAEGKFPQLRTILWKEVEEEQNDIYS